MISRATVVGEVGKRECQGTALVDSAGIYQPALEFTPMSALAISQFESDVAALQTSVDRAGRALGCSYSTSEEFEAAFVDARRRQGAFARPFQTARVALSATAVASLGALLLLAF